MLYCDHALSVVSPSVVVKLSHFRHLDWNCWTKFVETWEEARTQRPLTSLCFFFWPIGKPRWPPWPLICWDIFDFSLATADRNSTKIKRKLDNIIDWNVLCQFCVFKADQKTKMGALASDWLRHFYPRATRCGGDIVTLLWFRVCVVPSVRPCVDLVNTIVELSWVELVV